MKLQVVDLPPLDFYANSAISVPKWLNGPSEDLKYFMLATCAVSQHKLWEWENPHTPYVLYNPSDDTTYFLFKIPNNGTTFLVGHSLPPIINGYAIKPESVEIKIT